MINDSERDSFWDLDKLVPKKKPLTPFATKIHSEVCESTADDLISSRDASERRLSFEEIKTSEDDSYIPHGHSLIKKVVIKKKLDRYDFYDSFRKSAVVYFDFKGEECAFVQYYSFMPQYSQLSQAQKNYYFYWRSMVRKGKFIKTDYSYLYLYVYEIINLPDLIPPNEGIVKLTSLWRAYRRDLPRIDLYFSIWIQDYCLIHKLPPPTEQISDFVFEFISSSSFPEFYLPSWKSADGGSFSSVLAFLSDYDYVNGKYASGNPDSPEERRKRQAELYKIHLEGSIRVLLCNDDIHAMVGADSGETKILVRDAFPNSLCTHAIKSRLEIEYYPIGTSHEVRSRITAAVRYAENKLRGMMGVKSRLSVKGLPESYKSTLDGYFEALESRERSIREAEAMPEYEKLYSAPTEKLSFESADMIEAMSWDTTARLVADAEYDEEMIDIDVSDTEIFEQETKDASPDNSYGLDAGAIDFLSYLLGDMTDTYEPPRGFQLDSVAESINEAFYDSFGDVILEVSESGYIIIEDYMEDVREWLATIRR